MNGKASGNTKVGNRKAGAKANGKPGGVGEAPLLQVLQ